MVLDSRREVGGSSRSLHVGSGAIGDFVGSIRVGKKEAALYQDSISIEFTREDD